MLEKDIVRAIMNYLKTVPRCFCWKEHGGMYGTAGIPDIIACVDGRFYGFEEFFRSVWFQILTNLDGELLMTKIQKEVDL